MLGAESKDGMPKKTLPNKGEIRFNQPRSPLFLVLTLPARLLILIGDLTLKILKFPFVILKSISVIPTAVEGSIAKLSQIPRLHSVSLGMTKAKKKRGRPRSTPASIYYRKKFFKFWDRVFPKPARLAVFGIILTTFLFGYSLYLISVAKALPSPDQLALDSQPLTTEILDRDGNLLYKIYDEKNRQLVKLEDLPPYLIQATIASEDKNFYHHHGVDIFGILRAFKTNLDQGGTIVQGGSTITQQLIKNTLLTPDRTWQRKIKEALLAFWAERIYSKDEILTMYFNNVPYGGPCWGVDCASEMYFGKKPKDLTLAEATYLAGLPASPTEYSPYGTHPEKAKERQKEVVTRMVEERYIDPAKAEEVIHAEIVVKPNNINIKSPHFVMYVKALLSKKYGERVVSQGGLKVVTTLDSDIQELAEKKVQSNVEKLQRLNVTNGAAMVMDAKTGQILAMVGSKDYWSEKDGNFNMTLALRPPGSSIKPITYVTGFKQGYLPGTIMLDTPTAFPDGTNAPYRPVNYDGKFHGAVTIRTALGSSYNIPAVKMLSMVGLSEFVETARDMGITTWDNPENYGLSATLGGAPVTMIDMMSAYGTFAGSGVRHTATPILKVTDSKGKVLEEYSEQGKRVLTEELSYLISHILSDNKARVPAFGPGSLLEIPGYTVAVKTGTSDNKRDNWVFGYTPEYVVGTWVGNFDNSPMDPRLASGITGATPIWHEIFKELLLDQPNIAFKKPSGIIEASLEGGKDLAISGQTPKTVTALKKDRKREGEVEKEVVSYSDPFGVYSADSAIEAKKTN